MQSADFHLVQLRLVDALSREGSLSEAARQVGLTQSAASHALGRLREQLQDPLFLRTAAGMRPTPYGARVAASVAEALARLQAGLEKTPDFDPRRSAREFSLFLSGVEQMFFLPKLLERLAAEAPGVKVRVSPVPLKAPHLLLESGEVDLAIGPFTSLISGCRQQRLFRESYVCVARRDHPAFAAGMTMESFLAVPHALAEPIGHVHEHLDRWLERQNVSRSVRLRLPYFLALPLIVSRSDMLGIMAHRVAAIYADMVPLKIMPPPMKLPTYDIKMFWHERFHRDAANKWLRALFVEMFRD